MFPFSLKLEKYFIYLFIYLMTQYGLTHTEDFANEPDLLYEVCDVEWYLKQRMERINKPVLKRKYSIIDTCEKIKRVKQFSEIRKINPKISMQRFCLTENINYRNFKNWNKLFK
jgi:hypothetical protein